MWIFDLLGYIGTVISIINSVPILKNKYLLGVPKKYYLAIIGTSSFCLSMWFLSSVINKINYSRELQKNDSLVMDVLERNITGLSIEDIYSNMYPPTDFTSINSSIFRLLEEKKILQELVRAVDSNNKITSYRIFCINEELNTKKSCIRSN